MPTPLTIVDAFTSVAFSGNPAAVCVLSEPGDEKWMQNVALEMNLSETAFLYPINGESDNQYNLRWFTPVTEVDLCGHATLASAHALWEMGAWSGEKGLCFNTRSGVLRALFKKGKIQLDFPALEATPLKSPPNFNALLSVETIWVGKSESDYLVEVGDARTVAELKPNFGALGEIEARGIIVTAISEVERSADFVSRFFAPRVGIDEDPVTGSAHCLLGPYWGSKLKKNSLVGHQLSSREGEVEIVIEGERVLLAGSAVTILRGELC